MSEKAKQLLSPCSYFQLKQNENVTQKQSLFQPQLNENLQQWQSTMLLLDVSSDIAHALELLVTNVTVPRICAVNITLVAKEVTFPLRRIIAVGEVADKRPFHGHGQVQVLGCMCLEVSGRGEGQLAAPEEALDDARGISLVFALVQFQSICILKDRAAKFTLIRGRRFRIGNQVDSDGNFVVALDVLFEISGGIEHLLAPNLHAFEFDWLCISFMVVHVSPEMFGPGKALATQLAVEHPQAVLIFPVQLQIKM